MAKNEIQDILIEKGRKLIQEKGLPALTARKLSECSGYSVGTIYNQFGSMESYVLLQNYITLKELYLFMNKVSFNKNPYILLNNYLDAFITYVANNKNFWALLFNFHLAATSKDLSRIYLRQIALILNLLQTPFSKLYPQISSLERSVLLHTLWAAVFSLSSFLATNNSNVSNYLDNKFVCKILFNNFLAGITVLPEK